MAGDLTTVTELATALGMLGYPTIEEAIAARSPVMVNLTSHDWDDLDRLWAAGQHATAFAGGFENGRVFLAAPDALRGRPPALIEWKGSHRAPGDDAVPADLRIDHVYLVSCKYLSRNLHNRSPSRIFDRLLGGGETDPTDWYRRIAPLEHQALYEASVAATGLDDLPSVVDDLQADQRARLRAGLPTRSWPTAVQPAYAEMCQQVSTRTAQHWNARLPTLGAQEAMLWRLLRITHAPYFILGSDPQHPLRLRIHTPWDWRQRYRLRRFRVIPAPAGQPQVAWVAEATETATGHTATVAGHVEVRWSHGRFSGPPEAKVYLDTPHDAVPGYVAL